MKAAHRKRLADLGWHGFQVFISALLVTTSAGEYIQRLRTLEFWQDVLGSLGIAIVSQLLAYVAYRMCPKADDTGSGDSRPLPDASRVVGASAVGGPGPDERTHL